MITRRKAIVTSILSSFDSEEDVNEAVRLVSAAITGLSPAIQADVEYAATLTDATKEHHQAFPSHLSENALDLQLTACLAVGEILARKKIQGMWLEPLFAIAALSVSAYRLQPRASGTHLQSVHEALLASSNLLLARRALNARKRPELDLSEIEEFSPHSDVLSFWNQLKPILETALESLKRASEVDRDELEVLWWLYNDESCIFASSLSTLNAFDVAFSCSIELIDRAICPAPSSLKGIINGLVIRAAGKSKSAGKSIKTVLAAWTPEIIAALVPSDDQTKNIVKEWPKVLPLTWIANRVAESGVTTGWENEFAARTGSAATAKFTPEAFAEQIYAERTAQRLLFPFSGE
jgi:hypothetical protein